MTTSFTTFATATFASGNIVVVQSAENMVPGLPIVFSGTTFGNVAANATYYIGNITFGFPTSNITLTSLPGGATYALSNGSGNMTATFTQGGQQIIPTVPPGEPLNQAFDAINTNFDQIWAAGPVGTNIQIDENTILTLNTNGNLVLNPNGIGNVIANAHVIPDQDRVRNLGAFSLRWNTVYAQNFVGNGQGIANLTVSNISNGTTSVQALANGNVTVTVADNANVAIFTPEGLLINGTVSSSGNITAPTFFGNLVGNITGNIDAGGSNTQVQFNDDNVLAGSPGFTFDKNTNAVGITGTVTAGDILTAGAVSAVGNISANYFIGNGSQLTGLPASYTDANVTTLLANLGPNTINGTGAITTTANITGNYFIGNGSQLTGITADNVNADDLIGNTLSANVLYSNLITVGNLIDLSVVGNTNTGNLNSLGAVSAAGNIAGENIFYGSGVVSGTGNIYADKIFANIVGNVDAAGNLYEVQFNSTGDQLGATANFTYDSANNVFTVANGNIIGGNLLLNNNISATGNIVNSGFILAVGNVTAPWFIGNVDATTLSASSNITGGNINAVELLTAGNVSTAGNVNSGNIVNSGTISSTGNVTAPTFFGNLVGNITGNIDAGGANTEIQFNDDNVLAGSAAFTFDKSSNLVTISGNVDAGNVISQGVVTANLGVYGDIYTTSIDSADSSAIIVTPDMILLSGLNVNQDITVGNIVIPSYGNITVGNVRIANLADPVFDQDAVTKRYVDSAIGNVLPIITNQTITPDGSSLTYTLNQSTTAVGILVTINGISQTPNDSYTVVANQITFAEALLTTDVVQVRFLSGTTNTGIVYTVDSLPTASGAGPGARAFVNDSNTTVFYSNVGNSGSNFVPVFSDGTTWRVG